MKATAHHSMVKADVLETAVAMAPQTGWLQERSRILLRSSLGSLQSLVCIPCSSPELMSGLWDSSSVAQIVICQVRLIMLASHELLQRKQHSKQVSALAYEPCTVSVSQSSLEN